MSKKKLVTVAIIVMVFAILSYSTLAWFYADDKVTNNFEIDSSLNGFNIDVWELVENDEGEEVEVGKETKEDANSVASFTGLVPDVERTKTVHITNTSGNALATQYIMVKVTFTNYSAMETMGESNANFDCTDMLLGGYFDETAGEKLWWYDAAGVDKDAAENTVTYTFYLNKVLANGEDVVLFDAVMLPATMDINDVAALAQGGFGMKVVAYAVQSANIVAGGEGKEVCEWAKDAFAEYAVNPNGPTTTPTTTPSVPVDPS